MGTQAAQSGNAQGSGELSGNSLAATLDFSNHVTSGVGPTNLVAGTETFNFNAPGGSLTTSATATSSVNHLDMALGLVIVAGLAWYFGSRHK